LSGQDRLVDNADLERCDFKLGREVFKILAMGAASFSPVTTAVWPVSLSRHRAIRIRHGSLQKTVLHHVDFGPALSETVRKSAKWFTFMR